MRRNLLALAGVILVAVVAGDVWGQVQYTVTDLSGPPGYTFSQAYGVNNSGQAVGQAQDNGPTAAFLYTNGSMQDLTPLGGSALGINDNGQVVGYTKNSNGSFDAFLYSALE